MEMYKTALSLRGDHYYCPLALQLSTYWNCTNACAQCYLRRLNRTWGKELKPLDTSILIDQVSKVLDSKSSSALSAAVRARKTVYLGAKSDPYQPMELKYRATRESLKILLHYRFSVVIATKYTANLWEDIPWLKKDKYRELVTIMPIITPGWVSDWEILEHRGTTNPKDRLKHAQLFQLEGFNVGINGEPFIPGYHTVANFEMVVRKIAEAGLHSYNTYNLHFNDLVAKNLNTLNIDIAEIWDKNQNGPWKLILEELITISKKYGIVLGSPDFVNSGEYVDPTNTCCGIEVANPITFNFPTWKRLRQGGLSVEDTIEATWDGVGIKEEGLALLKGENKKMYSLSDISTGGSNGLLGL